MTGKIKMPSENATRLFSAKALLYSRQNGGGMLTTPREIENAYEVIRKSNDETDIKDAEQLLRDNVYPRYFMSREF